MTTTEARPISPDDPIDIHTHFGLSYANYLVLHRTLMQSMPLDWQHRMTACLDELDGAFRHVEQPEAFKVEAGKECELSDLMHDERAKRLTGVTVEWGPEDGEEDDGEEYPLYYINGSEAEHWHRVVVPTRDPVPHYDRGRTYIEPRLDHEE